MGPEQIRARLAEIVAQIEGITAGENGFTEEQLASIETFQAEFDSLNTQLNAAEKLESMKAAAVTSVRNTKPATPAPASKNIEVGNSRSDKYHGFKSAGEWLMAVKTAGVSNEIDNRLKNTMFEKVGEDGGFLVPEEISTAILKKMNGDDSLMAKTKNIQVSGNNLTLTLDESQPWNSGVKAYWTAEGDKFTKSQPKVTQASWRLHKLTALVEATDELLDDATALESFILASAPEAITHQVNSAILAGNGVGKPKGILNSSFTHVVAPEVGQAADTVVAANIVKMYSRMFPAARKNAVWYINPEAEEHLRLLKDDNGNFIYLAPGSQMNQTPYGTLMGRPVVPLLGSIPGFGDKGDIIFADLSYYYMIRKASGIKSATSIHLHFDREITAFRFSLRLDGKCPFTSPVKTENGNYEMSAFVTLAAR